MKRYTARELVYLRDALARGESIAAIARKLGRDRKALYMRAIRDGLREPADRRIPDAVIERIRREYADSLTSDLAASMGLKTRQVYNVAQRLGLRKSEAFFASDKATRIRRGKQHPAMIASRFKAGQAAWNKGMKGLDIGGKETRFRKGELSGRAAQLKQPIGATRINTDGYLDRKVTDTGYPPRDWQGVHRLAWIEANGPIPDGHIVVFKPGMRTNVEAEITPDRLECITRIENMRRNTYHNYPKPIAQAIQLRGALNRKINRRIKESAS